MKTIEKFWWEKDEAVIKVLTGAMFIFGVTNKNLDSDDIKPDRKTCMCILEQAWAIVSGYGYWGGMFDGTKTVR